ncbi:MAG: TM2 domain-containing protein [Negativicutes bacterium]|nr:TM2 domain-containing protein [Negativicutes bacterium]
MKSSIKMAMASLPPEAQKEFMRDLNKRSKSVVVAYLAWFLLGWHYLYLGKTGKQFAFWFTFGFLVVGWIVDFFRIPGMVALVNDDMALSLISQYKTMYPAAMQMMPSGTTLPSSSQQQSLSDLGSGGKGSIILKAVAAFVLLGMIVAAVTKNSQTKVTSASAPKEKDEGTLTQSIAAKSAPTPVILNIQAIAADQKLWPKTVSMKEALPISLGATGSITAPAGAALQLSAVGADGMLDVSWNGTSAKIPAAKTNIVELVSQQQTRIAEQKVAADARRAAEDAKPKPSQQEANAFYGITEQELVRRLGQPIRVKNENSPDGPYKMLYYSDTKGKECFFIIFASDGRVDNGQLRGVALSKATAEEEKVVAEIGPKPTAMWNGKVVEVQGYIERQLKDPGSLEIIGWTPVKLITLKDGKAWAVGVKYRAKNSFGGYKVEEGIAAIRHGQVVQFGAQ